MTRDERGAMICRVNLWFDPERGLPQFTFLGFTVCWRSIWDNCRGLEIVFARRWRLVHVWPKTKDGGRKMSDEATRIAAGFAEARANDAEAGWYGFVDASDIEALVARVVALEKHLRDVGYPELADNPHRSRRPRKHRVCRR
jgi:hypothetical protein